MLALLLAAMLSTATPAAATAPTPVQGLTVKSRSSDPDAVICRQEEVAGSRLTTRVCTTRAQREARERAAERFFQDRDDRSGMTQTMQAGNAMGGMGGH